MTAADTSPGKSPCRLFGLFAREANVGVLLRRGPSNWVRLIRWQTDTDAFEYGQWLHGRIYERRCDLSPTGRLMVYFAAKQTARQMATDYTCSWTAVSRPPWLTALALWPKGDCWAGGGLFDSEKSLLLNHRPGEDRPHPKHGPSPRLKIRPNGQACGEDFPLYAMRLRRDGWTLRQQGEFDHRRDWKTIREEIWRRRCPCGPHELEMVQEALDFKAPGGPYVLRFRVRPAPDAPWTDLGPATWADWDQQGRLVLTRDGGLYRGDLAVTGDYALDLLLEFNDMPPTAIESPPAARTWTPEGL